MAAETPEQAWAAFADGLRAAGERLAAQTADLDPLERADAYRALLRGLHNQLGRFEVDRERPELVAFNGWREKMFMDNPDFLYWVGDIRDDGRYRITGTMGDAVYLSITVYTSAGTLDAEASSRIDSDALTIAADGSFAVTLARDPSAGDWLTLPAGTTSVWVRQFYGDASSDTLGTCRIDALDDVRVAPLIDPTRFTKHLERLGRGISSFPSVFDHSTRGDLAAPNTVRHWAEMAGGAAFTEPNIYYLRGAWQLEPGQGLVVEGDAPECRYWNMLLYSRFLNSLDYRSRRVSVTNATATTVGGRYRFILSATEPGGAGDWLDTEGRPFGIFALRFLQPSTDPVLPNVRVVALEDLA